MIILKGTSCKIVFNGLSLERIKVGISIQMVNLKNVLLFTVRSWRKLSSGSPKISKFCCSVTKKEKHKKKNIFDTSSCKRDSSSNKNFLACLSCVS